MKKQFTIVALCGGLLASVLAGAPKAWPAGTISYLTFSGPVQLPGVTLPAGTYIFERMNEATSSHVVRVTNRDHTKVYFMGFTILIARPNNLASNRQITFREVPRGTPPEIDSWFLADDSTGEQFVYAR